MKNISDLSLENQQDVISKFAKMELGLLRAKTPEGEKILSITEDIIKMLVDSGLNIDDMKSISSNVESILNMNCISPLTFEDDEWCKVDDTNGVVTCVNYRSTKVRKIGDLVFPRIYKYHCSVTYIPETGKQVLNAVFAHGPNFEVSDGKLTGRVIFDWFLQYTKPPKAIAIMGNPREIHLEAKLMKLNDGNCIIYHDCEYPVEEETILLPFYLLIDELVNMDIKDFTKMSQDEISQLIQKYDKQSKPESYSRKESDAI